MSATDQSSDVLSPRQAASLLGVQPQTLRRWDMQGRLRALRSGPRGARRYARQDVLRVAQWQRERERNAQRVVVDVARAIAGSLDLHDVARTVVTSAVRIVGSHRCAVYLLSEDRMLLEPLFGTDVLDGESPERLFYTNPIPLEAIPLLRYSLDHPEPIVIDDTETHPLSNPEVFRFFNTRSLINIGLRGPDGHVFGMMPFVWTNEPHAVQDDELFFAQSLAALAEVALSNARLFAQVERERARATAISAVVRGVNSGHTLNETLPRAIESLVEQLGGDDGSIWLVDREQNRLICAAETQINQLTRRGATVSIANSPSIARAFEEQRPLLVPATEAQGDEVYWYQALKIKAGLFVPLFASERWVGMGFVNYLNGVPQLPDDDVRFAGLLGAQCTLAIERAQLLEDSYTRAAELEAMFDAMTDGVIFSDTQGRVLKANTAATHIINIEGSVPDLATRIARLQLRQSDGTPVDVDKSPTGRALRGDNVANMELLYTNSHGEERSLLLSSAPVYDEQGHVRAAVTVNRDITDVVATRRENMALAESFRRKAAELEAIVSQMGEGLIMADRNGRIVLINQYAAQLHGTSVLNVTPGNYSAMFQLFRLDGTPYPPLELPLSRAVLRGETVTNSEWLIRRPDGSEVIASGSALPITGPDGERLGAVVVMRDVTAHRQLQAEKDQFLSIVSHELKTPLTTLKGLNDLAQRRLMRGAPNEAILGNLRGVSQQVQRMEALISDLLDIRRLETGALPFSFMPLDIRSSAGEAAERAKAITERHTVELVGTLDQPLLVNADPGRIAQILDNLLSNAIKYSPSGGAIHIELQRSADRVLLHVHDQGIGIPEAGRERLFERFYRGANVLAAQYGGFGIGLALSREIAVQHGGSLTLESTSSQGSTFLLTLPLLESGAPIPE